MSSRGPFRWVYWRFVIDCKELGFAPLTYHWHRRLIAIYTMFLGVNSRSFRQNGGWSRPLLALIVVAVGGVAAVVVGVRWEEARGLVNAEQRTRAAAELHGSSLERLLDKFRVVPPMLAMRPDVIAAFDRPYDDARSEEAHLLASAAAAMTGALQIRFLTPDADVIATGHGPVSLYEAAAERSTSYFVAAMQGRLGRGHSLIIGDRPIYHFASAVRVSGEIVGVIVVDVSLEAVEQSWRLSRDPIVVTDQNGLVFLSSHASWRLLRISPPARDSAALPVIATENPLIFRVERETGDASSFVGVTRDIPILGWELTVLTDLAPVTQSKIAVGAIIILVVGGILVLLTILIRRKARAEWQHRSDQAMALRLERRVRDRTRALTKANAALASEVEERTHAEAELRATQAELVQAAKLAAIGQISAALSHEYSQPLTAIRSYAENAALLFNNGRRDEAADNLVRIVSLVERMARLSKTLRTYSRRASSDNGPTSVRKVLDEVVLLLTPVIDKASARVQLKLPTRDLAVIGDEVRLTQVLMNILSNAVDAVKAARRRNVYVTGEEEGGYAVLRIRDSGPGIPDEHQNRIFEPFFTTKAAGEGVGLGLSIAYKLARDLDAGLSFRNHPRGGAEFTLKVPLVRVRQLVHEQIA